MGDESVPDAIISQKSFKIVVETKLHNQFQQSQLEKHLTQFGTEEIKVLLTLDPKPMKESLMDSFGTVLKNYNTDRINEIKTPIRHVNITFEQLVAAMEDIVDDHMIDTMAVVSDLVIEDGPISQRFLELKRCIRTRIQYESKRFPRHIS